MSKPSDKATDRTVATPADTVSCVAASPVKYNGKRYAEGESLSLPQALYDELKAGGVVNAPDPVATVASDEKPAA